MEGTVCLIEDELVATSEQDGHSFALVGAASDLDDFAAATSADLFNETGRSELVGLKLVDVGDRGGIDSLRDEVNLVAIDVLDHHDLLLGEEMECQIIDGLTKNALLEKKHVGARLDDLLDDSKDVLTLFLDDSIHGSIVADDDVGLHVALWRADRELDEADFGVLDARGAASQVRGLLVDEAETFNQLRLIDGAAKLLADVNIAKVDVSVVLLVDDPEDSIDSHGGEEVRVMRDNLRRQGSDRVLNKLVAVVQVDRDRDSVDHLHGLSVGNLEAIRDCGGVETLRHEILACS